MNLTVRLKTEWWIIAVLVSLLAVVLTLSDALSRLDNAAYDHLLQLDPKKSDGHIALVEIDDDALAQLGRWPWDRGIHARLVDRLSEAAPKAIVYDTLFTEPGAPAGDSRLAGAIGRAGNVFLPFFVSAGGLPGGGNRIVDPIPLLRNAAKGTGFTDFLVDADGVMRSAPAPIGSRLHLMVEVHRSIGKGAQVPGSGRLIPFTPGEPWLRIPAASLIAGKVPVQDLRGKFVLVGVTAGGIGPRYPVPGLGTMSGLEINAQFLRGLLADLMIEKAGIAARIGFAVVPVWLLMLLMGPFPRVSPALGLAAATATVLAAAGLLLLLGRIWLPPATAVLALCIAYPIWGWRQLAITQRFMHRELLRLEADSTIFVQRPRKGRQPLPSTISLLTAAITSNRDMKHFVAERLDQLPDATLVTNGEGKILLANASAGNLFGPEQVRSGEPGKGAALLGRFRQAGFQEPIRFPDMPTGGALSFDAITDDGHFFAIRFAPQRSVDGGFVGWIVQFMDVSEAKAAQRQRDDILELLTHDMRSPQASILAVLETAPSENIAPEEARRIRHYAERTLGLADGFVQLARAESLEYALEDVALGDMMIDAIDDLWPQLTAKSISIDTADGEERLIVRVERSLMTRALINLLDNAIKYSPVGSHIRCTVRQEPGDDNELRAICEIVDEGPGLEEEHRHRLFERFHRGPLGAGRRTDGVGLGLSFVHTVVVRHRGEVRCASEAGRGATFTLALPLADQGQA
ncbi:CHASE2 domain-containing protein [Novosphingobium sp. RL4]|uniref:CHASE2 domain-containing protein n=1 Tax=Novosphingobium sp. RL4 TaxID=3109595 RepID=UPI002D77EA98|nr:CHASE2 domain-containing protein [Novosphingobium sp. RL4]WRT95289.1 CHASE2 domain-containing protein [Novosphingobium sp. RL4]